MIFRALLVAMDNWATENIPPPENQLPKSFDGTLVDFEDWKTQFPVIPRLVTPQEPNKLSLYDFGPETDRGILEVLPPRRVDNSEYVIKVPSVDDDGNELAGSVFLLNAPLATYTIIFDQKILAKVLCMNSRGVQLISQKLMLSDK